MQPPLARRPAPGAQMPRMWRRTHRRPQLQSDVQNIHRPRRRRRLSRLPPPRNRPGHLRQLRERPQRLPQAPAIRHSPNRQGVSQRNHHRRLYLSHPRIRNDGDRVLRRAGRRRKQPRALDRGLLELVHIARRPQRQAARPRPRTRRAFPLLQGDLRH